MLHTRPQKQPALPSSSQISRGGHARRCAVKLTAEFALNTAGSTGDTDTTQEHLNVWSRRMVKMHLAHFRAGKCER